MSINKKNSIEKDFRNFQSKTGYKEQRKMISRTTKKINKRGSLSKMIIIQIFDTATLPFL
jgi:hypothetical protein